MVVNENRGYEALKVTKKKHKSSLDSLFSLLIKSYKANLNFFVNSKLKFTLFPLVELSPIFITNKKKSRFFFTITITDCSK